MIPRYPDRLTHGVHLQFPADAFKVVIDGKIFDLQRVGDALIVFPLHQFAEYFPFAFTEVEEPGSGATAVPYGHEFREA